MFSHYAASHPPIMNLRHVLYLNDYSPLSTGYVSNCHH